MKVKKQKLCLPIKTFEFDVECESKHGKLFPNNVRALIVGTSGCGKTSLVLSLLFDKNGLKFKNVYLFSKSINQAKYSFLENVLKRVKGVNYFRFADEILDVDRVNKYSVCIFDDLIGLKQAPIQEFFARGRHRCLDLLFLCQSYSRVAKQLIRDNANLIVLFKMDELNLKHAYRDSAASDMTYQKFRELCWDCWKDGHGFLVISKESPLSAGRYRRGFDAYINP